MNKSAGLQSTNTNRITRFAAVSFLAMLIQLPFGAHAAVGRMQGMSSVSKSGEATYSIPIVVPPGTRGMTPQLALVYGHRNASTLLGSGWGIAGLSAISRCGRTWAADGEARDVRNDYSDRFCLDGNKLRLTGGTYGYPAATYQTEIATFTYVTSNGTVGNGPISFVAETSNGLIYEYGDYNGSSGDALIESVGQATARAWAVKRIRDRSGNAMVFTYAEDATNGAYRIEAIDYTSNPNQALSSAYRVDFVWETKPTSEIDSGYIAGSIVKEITRLDRVDVTYNSAIVRRYELNYDTALSSTSKSRLASVQECAGAALDCLPPTNFLYQNGTPGLGAVNNTGQSVPTTPWPLDINGDGRDDLVYSSSTTSGAGYWMIMFANAGGGYDAPFNTTRANTNYQGAIPIDYNADGLDDLLVPSGGTWWVMLGSALGLSVPTDTEAPVTTTGSGTNARALDVNGDGLEDLVWADLVGYAGGDTIRYRLRVWGGKFSTDSYILAGPYAADTAITSAVFAPSGQPFPRRTPDFNGDGRGDLLFRSTHRIWISDPEIGGWRYSSGIQVICPGSWSYGVGGTFADSSPYFGDFNGDGKTDLVYYNQSSQMRMRFSTGTALGLEISLGSLGSYGTEWAILDWDSDGYDDLLLPLAGTWRLRRSTGEELSSAVNTPLATGTRVTVADINGDGLSDLASNVSGTWQYFTHAGTSPDLLQTVTDGYSNTVSFNYAPLTTANYGKYNNSTYPSQDYVGSLQVVNSSSESDGIGGSYSNIFSYYGARLNLQGRGFEGFYAKRTYDSRNALSRYQYFRRDFPFTGATFQDDLYQSDNATLIRRAESSFTATALDTTANNQRYFPYVYSTTVQDHEMGPWTGGTTGRLVTTTTTNYTFDSFGNATNVVSTVTDNDSVSPYYGQQWGTTTARTISPQPGCLNLPTQETVTNTAPGVPAITRTVAYTPDYAYCRMSQVVTEPSNLTYKVTRDLGYDGFGNVNSGTVTGISMPARTTNVSWGTTGQFPVSMENALDQPSSMGYDYRLGLQTSHTDPNNLTTTFGYDGFGRKTSEVRADGTSTTWAYADCSVLGCVNTNNRVTVTETIRNSDSSVRTEQLTYFDQLDRPLVQSQRLLSGYNRTETRYDARGRVWEQSAPCAVDACAAYWSTFSYDDLNRVTLQQRPISASNSTLQSTSIAYSGRTIRVTDPQGTVTTKISTVVGSLGRSQDHNGYYQSFSYDAVGSLLSVSDSLSNTLFTATYDYGIAAFRRSVSDMDLGTRSNTYNALGELVNGSDGKGQSFSATFDALSRPLTRVEAEGTTTWTWGGVASSYNIGQLQGVSSPGYSEQFTYDNRSRLINRQIVTDATYAYDYAYNNETGLLDTLTYPTSTSSYRLRLKYAYQNGILQQVKDDNSSTVFWAANTVNPRGQVLQTTLGNGVVTNRVFDAVTGWLSSVQSGVGGGAALQNESYLFDRVGNVTQRQENNLGLTENFYYDDLHRLDYSALNGVANLDLSYDAMGNILNRSDVADGAAWTYHSTKKHAVLQAGSASITYTYTYDANGNAQTRNGYGITWTSYNYPSVITGPGKTLTFNYGPNRERYRQVYENGSTTELTMYIGGSLEKVSAGGVVDWRHYVSVAGQTVAVVSRQSTGTNSTRYVLEDHQGSVAQITDSSGTLYVRESFTAFGARRDATDWSGSCMCTDLAKMKSVTRKGYTGHEAIGGVSMGLNHMNGRVQDAITGRFLSADPYITAPGHTQGFNRYAYVMNNPITLTDLSGFGIDPPKLPENQSTRTRTIGTTGFGWERGRSMTTPSGFDSGVTPDGMQFTISPVGAGPRPGSTSVAGNRALNGSSVFGSRGNYVGAGSRDVLGGSASGTYMHPAGPIMAAYRARGYQVGVPSSTGCSRRDSDGFEGRASITDRASNVADLVDRAASGALGRDHGVAAVSGYYRSVTGRLDIATDVFETVGDIAAGDAVRAVAGTVDTTVNFGGKTPVTFSASVAYDEAGGARGAVDAFRRDIEPFMRAGGIPTAMAITRAMRGQELATDGCSN